MHYQLAKTAKCNAGDTIKTRIITAHSYLWLSKILCKRPGCSFYTNRRFKDYFRKFTCLLHKVEEPLAQLRLINWALIVKSGSQTLLTISSTRHPVVQPLSQGFEHTPWSYNWRGRQWKSCYHTAAWCGTGHAAVQGHSWLNHVLLHKCIFFFVLCHPPSCHFASSFPCAEYQATASQLIQETSSFFNV